MSAFSWAKLRQEAARHPARIVLADGDDSRVIEAAKMATKFKVAEPLLLSSRTVEDRARWTQALQTISKFRDLSADQASERVSDPLVRGCLMLREKMVDGFIGGATRPTGDVLRTAFSIIGLAPKAGTLFGYFILEARDGRFVILADCAVVPDPSSKQLAHIAIGAAEACQSMLGQTPNVAFLSFSTKGSAEHPFVDKIRQAVVLARQKSPDLLIEGEWQADAALDVFSAKIKGVGDSPMAGKANVLIAPNLETGNIAYKLIQRLGGCRAVGPVLHGMAQPANDLSRGCSAEDIVDLMALTSLQTQHLKERENMIHAH